MTPTLMTIFELCIIPLLSVLTAYIVAFIKRKIKEMNDQIDSETAQKYLSMLGDIITSCVIATNQTYVDTLKKENKFDMEAQKKAFILTRTAVLEILSEEAYNFLQEIIGDLNTYIDNQIEAVVNVQKMPA